MPKQEKQQLTEEEKKKIAFYENEYIEGRISMSAYAKAFGVNEKRMWYMRKIMGIDKTVSRKKHEAAIKRLRHEKYYDTVMKLETDLEAGKITLNEFAKIMGISTNKLYKLREEFGITYNQYKKVRPGRKVCHAKRWDECFTCPFDDCIRPDKKMLEGETQITKMDETPSEPRRKTYVDNVLFEKSAKEKAPRKNPLSDVKPKKRVHSDIALEKIDEYDVREAEYEAAERIGREFTND